MAQFAVCLDTHPNSWGCRDEGADQQVLSIPSGSRGTAPGAGRVLLALLLGERGCGKGWSQGKSLWGNPKPPPTAEPEDLLMESCKWNGCGDTGNPGSFPEKFVCSWDPPAALVLLSLLPVLPRAAVPWLGRCWLCSAAVTAAAVAPEIVPREVLNWEPSQTF